MIISHSFWYFRVISRESKFHNNSVVSGFAIEVTE